jgi:opacity protein-like surface antigen
MSNKLKALGLTLMATLAVGALAASAAQAHTAALFHSEGSPTRVTITQEGEEGTTGAHHVFDAAGASITCKGAHFEGTQATVTAETLTVTATYTNCTFLGANVNVEMRGCDYVLHANGEVDIEPHGAGKCEVGTDAIKFAAPGCTVEVGKQTGLKELTFKNINGESEITSEAHLVGIKYSASGFLCPTPGANQTNGQYTTGNTVSKGETTTGTPPTPKKIWWTATVP